MKNSTVRLVVILGAIAVAGILLIQVYWFWKNHNRVEADFHQTVSIALLNVAKKMAGNDGTILPSSGLIKRVSSNYYVVNFNNIIDANYLEYYLLEEFGNLGLNTSFEYAIYDCSNDEMVYGNYCDVENPEKEPGSDQKLLKYDEFIYYFGVKFPNHESYLLSDMRVTVIFSIITLMAMAFFLYAISVILRQKRMSELQRDFINNMTHEFKTPISSIRLSNNVLREDEAVRKNPRLSRYAMIIQQQSERLNEHVEKVLSIARMDDDQFVLHKGPVDLHAVIEELVQSKDAELSEKGVNLRLELQATNPVVHADKLHLSNVLYNLLDNAIKYAGTNPVIVMKTEDAQKHILFSMQDNGIGISAEHQKHLFTKFFRVPTGNVHNVKGFGLGLFYVKKIVDQHKWKIGIVSEEGKGTKMEIAFGR
ncbi:MAG TPA: HAMP domain-containing sensor histidine kinase [Saprospiraceae bacterium]|nr:HAMP domain-containing sensor histidine kinase [Saprospiraceae bacterium]